MSSHASSQNQPDPTQALTIERKKTKVLKSALKQERKDRAALEEEQKKSKEQIDALNIQLQEKVSSTSIKYLTGKFIRPCRKNAILIYIKRK